MLRSFAFAMRFRQRLFWQGSGRQRPSQIACTCLIKAPEAGKGQDLEALQAPRVVVQPAGDPRAVRDAAEGPAGSLRRGHAGAARPKEAAGPHGAGGRQLIRTLHEGLLAAGIAVPLTQALRVVRRAAADGLSQADQGRTIGRSASCRADQDPDRDGAALRRSHRGLASGLQRLRDHQPWLEKARQAVAFLEFRNVRLDGSPISTTADRA